MGAVELGHLRVEGFSDVVELLGGGTAGGLGEEFFELQRRLGELIGHRLRRGSFGGWRGIKDIFDGSDAGAVEAAVAIEVGDEAGDGEEIDGEGERKDVEEFFHGRPRLWLSADPLTLPSPPSTGAR